MLFPDLCSRWKGLSAWDFADLIKKFEVRLYYQVKNYQGTSYYKQITDIGMIQVLSGHLIKLFCDGKEYLIANIIPQDMKTYATLTSKIIALEDASPYFFDENKNIVQLQAKQDEQSVRFSATRFIEKMLEFTLL